MSDVQIEVVENEFFQKVNTKLSLITLNLFKYKFVTIFLYKFTTLAFTQLTIY